MAIAKLLSLALPNVEIDAYVQTRFKEFAANNTRKVFTLGDFGINEYIQPLIEKLALKRPEWRFAAFNGNFHSRDDADLVVDFEVKDFQVFDKREVLGAVRLGGYSYKTKGHSFLISNHRTSAVLSRTSSYQTGNIDKAGKLVLKHFGAKDDMELYQDAITIGVDMLSEQARLKGGMVRRMWSEKDRAAFAFVLARWDEFLSTIIDVKEREALSKLPEVQKESLLLDKLYQGSITSHADAYTICQQGDYYLMRGNSGALEKKLSEELPNNVRHKLGILKLIKDGQAVSDIGFRANETTFIIFKDKS